MRCAFRSARVRSDCRATSTSRITPSESDAFTQLNARQIGVSHLSRVIRLEAEKPEGEHIQMKRSSEQSLQAASTGRAIAPDTARPTEDQIAALAYQLWLDR